MFRHKEFYITAALSIALYASAWAKGLPSRVGECVSTRITELHPDEDITGSRVSFENGGVQESYETVQEVEDSNVGDPVRMCLISIPTDCPKGDNRGRIYRTTNLRTRQTWEMSDSKHICGGA